MGVNLCNTIECCGCRACQEICPQNCISMNEDAEGFVYPIVDTNKCIGCHLCEKTCPLNYSFDEYCFDQRAWVGKHESEDVRFNSSSGGAFTALYELALREKYVVYGVRWGNDFKVIHDRAMNEEQCKTFRKSKYVLSDTNGCFQRVSDDLKKGEKVLFSGTPCQCAALNRFLRAKNILCDNLIIVDIVCHGAPGQKVFDRYITELKPDNKKIYKFRFKNKIEYCGQVNSRTAQVIFEDGESKILDARNDPFIRGYYGRLFYRPSCGVCKFARLERPSDITIADAWGVEDIYQDLDSLSGVSLLISNSLKGEKIISEIYNVMNLREADIEWAHGANSQLNRPTTMHKGRSLFFDKLDSIGFSKSVKVAMARPLWKRVLGRLKRMFINFVGGGGNPIRTRNELFEMPSSKLCLMDQWFLQRAKIAISVTLLLYGNL